jgi:hypothetical protein
VDKGPPDQAARIKTKEALNRWDIGLIAIDQNGCVVMTNAAADAILSDR